MQKISVFSKIGLTVLTLNLTLFNSQANAQEFSGFANDPGTIDSGIPGFVGSDGLGIVSDNNIVNPIFEAWATGFINYLPAPGVDIQFQTPEKTLGPVTAVSVDIASLGELTEQQITDGVSPGQITLTFDRAIINGDGADFAVFENGFGFADTGNLFAELAYVEVSTNGIDFIRFPSISRTENPVDPIGVIDPTRVFNLAGKHVNNGVVVPDDFILNSWGTPFDLDVLSDFSLVQTGVVDLDNINFVRIVDIPGNGAFLDSENRPIFDPFPTPPGPGGFDLEAIGIINGEPVPEPTSIVAILVSVMLGFTRRRN
ncbi:PEP-CTERM sorting domain-containing protein [Crocosphaera sp.]|uniref:PEP-CTERM sorting domain-containing protein n=1 Tax=Crocosphaera sp. TaxID=2729996 RepID=UPI00262F9246|nr:PEP-CTERM sorting domain-containing protein [Crocosphaera sp.]MDJ0582701.1 PEP-CTERM sorting domain-containing protein [Crocosphaera sp.]